MTLLITGSMGAGKSCVISHLRRKGYPVFQADAEAKKNLSLKSPISSSLKTLFPDCYRPDQMEFDRKKIAREIFKDDKKRQAVEALIHPLVQESFKKFVQGLEKQGKSAIFCEAPLISKDIFDRFDKSILITCPKSLKKKRLLKKGWTEKEIEDRLKVQIPESKVFYKVDFILENNGSLKKLANNTDKMLELLGI